MNNTLESTCATSVVKTMRSVIGFNRWKSLHYIFSCIMFSTFFYLSNNNNGKLFLKMLLPYSSLFCKPVKSSYCPLPHFLLVSSKVPGYEVRHSVTSLNDFSVFYELKDLNFIFLAVSGRGASVCGGFAVWLTRNDLGGFALSGGKGDPRQDDAKSRHSGGRKHRWVDSHRW